MGIIKGQLEYQKFKEGKKLTWKEAILAQCYECNGLEESNEDCGCKGSCPLYQYHPHRPREKKKKKATPEQLERMSKARALRFK